MVSCTSARPSGGRPDVPAKMTSSILPPRRLLAPCSPITQASASTTLDLPDPLGPTMQVMPGSSCMVVEEAKDLNPLRVRLFRYTGSRFLRGHVRVDASANPRRLLVGGRQLLQAYGQPTPAVRRPAACRGAAHRERDAQVRG